MSTTPSRDCLSGQGTSNNHDVSIELDNIKENKSNAKESKSSLDSKVNLENLKIPDGGWGWIVVFATFMLCTMRGGFFSSLKTLISEQRKMSKSENWILHNNMFNLIMPLACQLTGPLAGALVDVFGCRTMTIVGGIVSASGFVLCLNCDMSSLMYLIVSTLTGIGLCLIYMTVVVSVMFWFDKRRTFAIGIGASGIYFGSVVFSRLTDYSLRQFGWIETTLILGACFLNMCICGAVMRDPDWITGQNRQAKICSNKENTGQGDNVDQIETYQGKENSIEHNQDEDPANDIRGVDENTLHPKDHEKRGSTYGESRNCISCPIFCGSRNLSQKMEKKNKSKIQVFVEDLFDFSLFLEIRFCLLSLSTVIFFTWSHIPYLSLHLMGSAKEASFTLSNIELSGIMGLLWLGWLGDRPWMNLTLTYGISLIICGLSMAGLSIFKENYFLLQICAFLFGLSKSSQLAFTPGIIMEMVPLDRFTIAYGSQLFCQGIGSLCRLFPEFKIMLTQEFEEPFFQAEIWIVVSGISVAMIPYCKNIKLVACGSVENSVDVGRNKFLALRVLYIMAIISLLIIFCLSVTDVFSWE